MLVVCENCGIEFDKKPHDVRRTNRNYCCAKCKTDASRKYNEIIIKEDYAEIVIKYKKEKIITFVDIEDIDKIKDIYWVAHFEPQVNNYYIRGRLRTEKREHTMLHRYIMNTPSDMQVDHINHNTLDNRKYNLRNVMPSQNMQNLSGAHIRNKLNLRNVFVYRNNYMIKITVDGESLRWRYKVSEYSLEQIKEISEKLRKEYMPFATC